MAAIDIRQMTNISISGDGAGQIFCFDLADGSRKYQLKAETPGVALAWVKNLQVRGEVKRSSEARVCRRVCRRNVKAGTRSF